MQSGEILTIADLPKAGLSRWTAARKSTVICAVMFGLISTDEASTLLLTSSLMLQLASSTYMLISLRMLRWRMQEHSIKLH